MLFRLLLVAILGFFGTSKNVFGQTNFRLVGGTSNSNGRVEVFYNGTWGTICDDGWSPLNTRVVCRSLNFASGYRVQTYLGTGRIWLDDVRCVGTEPSLAECNHASWGSNNCAHIEDISLQCVKGINTSTEQSSSESPITVRLAGGDGTSYGRVEILYRGQWGTICDDLWDNKDARVICRMLGYNDGIAFSGGRYGQGTGTIWVDNAECIGNERSIAQCPRNRWGDNNCGHIEDAGVECSTRQQIGTSGFTTSTAVSITDNTASPLSIRLMGGHDTSNGRVEILYRGNWGTVCDDQWDDSDAHVICHMLGYSGGTAQGNARYGPGTGGIWLDEVNCLGNETSIDQCGKNDWGQHNCGHAEDAGVDCTLTTQQPLTSTRDLTAASTTQPVTSTKDLTAASTTQPITTTKVTTPVSVRLAGGNGRSNGRVEILYQEQWGTVCDDRWDAKEANVICHMLGYSGGTAQGNARYGPGTGNIWLDEVDCLGNETSINQCQKNDWGQHNCGHAEDAGVDCYYTTQQPLSTTKGFTTQQTLSSTRDYTTQQPLSTTKDFTTQQTLSSTRAITTPVSVRLAGGNGRSNGRVEILYQGQWGTVCDDRWDAKEANVICHMLGYSGGTAQGNARYGPGTGNIWLDEVDCLGNETSINQCLKNDWGQHNCGHAEDAGVDCYYTTQQPLSTTKGFTTQQTLSSTRDYTTQQPLSTTKDFTTQQTLSSTRAITTPVSVRLVGGNGRSNGRVEILYQGQWGTVCDDNWDDKDANVICHMLGYRGGTAQGNGRYGPGTGQILLDEVNCLGNETSIDECLKKNWGEHNCVHSEDAGVDCSFTTFPTTQQPMTSTGGNGQTFRTQQPMTSTGGNRQTFPTQQPMTSTGGNGQAFRTTQQPMTSTGGNGQAFRTTQQPMTNTGVSTMPRTSTSIIGSVFVRLVGSNSSSAGRVEIFYQEQWGTVCDDQWDNNDARVICHMLGFSDGISTTGGSFGPGNGSIWLDEVKCSGNEQSITECSKNPWGSTDCKHSEDAGVKCGITSTTTSSPLLAIRLVGGNSPSSGRVEINYHNKWGTVCQDKWDDNDARVVCHMLGYNHGIAFNAVKYGMGSGDIWLDEVNCTGTESSIADCPRNPWGVHDCHHGEDAGVDCSTNAIPVSVRLVGGQNPSAGRVELNLYGEWGTVCDDGWDNNDARVICRMLGYVDGIGLSYSWYGAGTGKIFLDEVNCVGNETSIIDCKKNAWESSNCNHGEDASVHCFSQKVTTVTPSLGSDVSVRLAGGNSLNRGRVEIQYNGQWGTICDDAWDDRDARVVCQMLGYVDGSASGPFAAGTGPIWLDQVECRGSESSIVHCVRNRWGVHDCSHNEDAGVECSNTIIRTASPLQGFFTTTPRNRGARGLQQARLIGGDNFTVGRLEVMINNVWGTVCDDNWDNRDATVACRMLGFSSGIGYRNARFGSGTGQIWLDELNCTGTEMSLSQCASPNAGLHDCSHSEDASVQCFRSGTTTPTTNTANIRLAEGQNTNEGRVEIYHQGQWGTICNNNWDVREVTVVCRMLGFREGDILSRNIPGIGIIWLSNVNCIGGETSLEQCNKSDWGVQDCQHTQDVSIICL